MEKEISNKFALVSLANSHALQAGNTEEDIEYYRSVLNEALDLRRFSIQFDTEVKNQVHNKLLEAYPDDECVKAGIFIGSKLELINSLRASIMLNLLESDKYKPLRKFRLGVE